MTDWDAKERQIRVGQAINMAHAYLVADHENLKLGFEAYQKELQDKTLVFKAMIDKIQKSFENADNAQKPVPDDKPGSDPGPSIEW